MKRVHGVKMFLHDFFFWDKAAFMHLTILVSQQHSQAWKFSWYAGTAGLPKSDGENEVVKWSFVSKSDARKQHYLEKGIV